MKWQRMMNMKNKGIILGFIVMVILIAIFMKKPIETKKEIRYNTTHKREDYGYGY